MVLKHKLTENLFALNGAHIARYLFPLITVSYLTRRLGVEVWGLVAFAQAFGVLVSLLVEYGFNLTATREVARNQEDAESHADLLAGVLGVQRYILRRYPKKKHTKLFSVLNFTLAGVGAGVVYRNYSI